MANKTHYPPPDYIAGIYNYRAAGNYDKMREYFSKDFVAETMGSHSLAGSGGIEHSADVAQKLDGLLDASKSSKVEVVRVVGGGDQAWACIDIKSVGTTKAGKDLNHEYLLLVRFDLDWKIAEIKAFHDTAHINEHLNDAAKA